MRAHVFLASSPPGLGAVARIQPASVRRLNSPSKLEMSIEAIYEEGERGDSFGDDAGEDNSAIAVLEGSDGEGMPSDDENSGVDGAEGAAPDARPPRRPRASSTVQAIQEERAVARVKKSVLWQVQPQHGDVVVREGAAPRFAEAVADAPPGARVSQNQSDPWVTNRAAGQRLPGAVGTLLCGRCAERGAGARFAADLCGGGALVGRRAGARQASTGARAPAPGAQSGTDALARDVSA